MCTGMIAFVRLVMRCATWSTSMVHVAASQSTSTDVASASTTGQAHAVIVNAGMRTPTLATRAARPAPHGPVLRVGVGGAASGLDDQCLCGADYISLNRQVHVPGNLATSGIHHVPALQVPIIRRQKRRPVGALAAAA